MDKWNLKYYYEILHQCEDVIANEVQKYKTGNDYPYYLLSMYAKAILNTKEVLCLLMNGFPDGALSRARDIYEQMVIALYIKKNYTENLIKRYWADYDYQCEKCKKELYGKLKEVQRELFKEYEELERKCDVQINHIKKQYGKITRNYWWTGDKKVQTFRQMQKSVDAGVFMVLYNRACISTHANALGDSALLGRNNKNGSLLRTDETYEGFEAPILLAMLSFDLITNIIFEYFNLKLPENYTIKEMCKPLWKKVFI